MRLPTQILLLGAILTNGARANTTAPAVEPTAAPKPAASATTPAATDSDSEVVRLEPVLVTADLWETPLEKISASVSVYDGAALAREGVRHFGDLADQIPNLTYTGGTSRPRYFQIRGIGENSQYEGETPDSSVAFKVDDLDFTGLGGIGSTFDVRQVEVLRGPQAGAFGANAAGGVIRIVTNDPTPYWTGLVEGSAGGDNLREGGFAVGGPLLKNDPEKLMFRLAVQQHASDGFRKNVTLNRDTNARDELFGRLKVTFNPNEAWQWNATAFVADQDNGFDDFALDNNGSKTFSDEPGRDVQKSRAGSLRGERVAPSGLRFTTITTGTWADSIYSYDDDWTAGEYFGFSDLRRDRRVLTQELRLDGEADGVIQRWTAGVFFNETKEDGVYRNNDPFNIRGLDTSYNSDGQAIFGQVGRDLTSRTRMIFGLRAERVDSKGEGLRTRFRKIPATFDPEQRIRSSFSDTMVGGKLTLEHELPGERILFASVTRGYKAGGVNQDARINPAVDPLTYDTETLWNYELGMRGNWLEKRLSGQVTAFYLDRQNTQVRDSAGFGGNYRFFTDNADDAYVYGLEAASAYEVGGGWTVHGSLALMESKLDPFTLSNGNTSAGGRLANTPSYGYTLGVKYRPFATGWNGSVDWVARGKQFDSNNHNEARRAFDVVNASLGYSWDRWSVTLWAKNLFDETYDKRVFFFGNEDPLYIDTRYESRADPRQLGVSAAYRF